jgi:hypothetical protein
VPLKVTFMGSRSPSHGSAVSTSLSGVCNAVKYCVISATTSSGLPGTVPSGRSTSFRRAGGPVAKSLRVSFFLGLTRWERRIAPARAAALREALSRIRLAHVRHFWAVSEAAANHSSGATGSRGGSVRSVGMSSVILPWTAVVLPPRRTNID